MQNKKFVAPLSVVCDGMLPPSARLIMLWLISEAERTGDDWVKFKQYEFVDVVSFQKTTVERSLALLTSQGYIERVGKPGIGTFVHVLRRE